MEENKRMFKALFFERHLSHLQAALYSTFAYFMFTVSDSMGKWLMTEGYDRTQVLVINSIPSTILIFIFLLRRYGWRRFLRTSYKKLHFLRAAAIVSVTFCSFTALKILPIADFYGVMFSAPLAVTVVAVFLFKEKTDLKEWIMITIGFCGVVLVVNPDFHHFNTGYIWAILAVFSIVSAGIIVRKIGRDESPFLFVLFGNIGIISVNIIPAVMHDLPAITWTHIALFAAYSVSIPTAIFTLTSVFARAPAITAVAPYQYFQIIWGGLIGYFVFGDVPQNHTIAGSLIVISCGLYILLHHRRKSRRQLKEVTTPTSNV